MSLPLEFWDYEGWPLGSAFIWVIEIWTPVFMVAWKIPSHLLSPFGGFFINRITQHSSNICSLVSGFFLPLTTLQGSSTFYFNYQIKFHPVVVPHLSIQQLMESWLAPLWSVTANAPMIICPCPIPQIYVWVSLTHFVSVFYCIKRVFIPWYSHRRTFA